MSTERLVLIRQTPNDKDGIYGVLTVPEIRIHGKKVIWKIGTSERPWLDNKVGESCIPTGTYPLIPRRVGSWARRVKKNLKHSFVLEIGDVPGRSEILIHYGNWPMKDSEGCILVGERTKDTKDKFIAHSRKALDKLYNLVQDLYAEADKVEIVIRNG